MEKGWGWKIESLLLKGEIEVSREQLRMLRKLQVALIFDMIIMGIL
jgi:hypothetical protein